MRCVESQSVFLAAQGMGTADNMLALEIVTFITDYMIAAIPPLLPLTIVFLGCGAATTELEVCRQLLASGRVLQRVILMDAGPRSVAHANMTCFEQHHPDVHVMYCQSYSNLASVLDVIDFAYLLPMGVNNGMDLRTTRDVYDVFSFFVSCEKLRTQSGQITGRYCNFLDNRSGAYDKRDYIKVTDTLAVARYTWWQYAIKLLESARTLITHTT